MVIDEVIPDNLKIEDVAVVLVTGELEPNDLASEDVSVVLIPEMFELTTFELSDVV